MSPWAFCCLTVTTRCSAGSQTQPEQRLQDDPDGRDDRLLLSPLCAESERETRGEG